MPVDARSIASALAMQLVARNALLGPHLFPISPWEIMINLMAEDRPVTPGELAAALGAAGGTTERWFRVLEQEGVVERVTGARFEEGSYRLTASGLRAMERILAV